jgi:homoserine kinase
LTEPITFQTPASTANLGPGFGVLGLALDLALTTTVTPATDGKVTVERCDDPDADSLDPRHDTVLRGLQAAAQLMSVDLSDGVHLRVEGDVPRGAGLGTNSAGFAAGIGAAVRLAKDPHSNDALVDDLADILVGLGGDPGHGAASLIGGLVATCLVSRPHQPRTHHLLQQPLDPAWRYVLVLPDLQMGTAEISRVLPATLPHAVITRNTSRLVGLLKALATGDEDLLGPCLFDEVHVPFRRQLIPGLEKALAAGQEAGAAGVTISGHGPSLFALTTDEQKAEEIGAAIAQVFRDHGVSANSVVSQASPAGALPVPDSEPESK